MKQTGPQQRGLAGARYPHRGPAGDRRAIVERITIGGEEIELTLAALPPFPKMTTSGQRTPGDVLPFCRLILRAAYPMCSSIPFNGMASLEVDLLCADARVAVELDGAQHLGDPIAYRRDRRKDQLLQEHGYLVLRFLAEDVGKELDMVLDAILRSLSNRPSRVLPARPQASRGGPS